ncbi:MAG: hypothetical protein ACLQAS_06100 [Thermoplasmata archaeon]
MSARISAYAAVVGVIIGAAFVTVPLSIHGVPTTTVQFDGVEVNTTYLNGSASIFGPPSQNGCNQTFPIGPQWPTASSNCPTQLVGGTSYDFSFFETGNPGSWPGLWANMTVMAPFNFTIDPGVLGSVPTTLSSATGLFEGGANELFDSGEYMGWALVFTFPQSFTSPSGGLWLHATLTVQPTNQTTMI